MAKSYFAILGVASDASDDEIRSAYRRLAKEFHPDHYTGGREPFRQVQEAYTVLGDPRKRSAYQSSLAKSRKPVSVPKGPSPVPEPEPLIPGSGPVDMGHISPVRSFHRLTPSRDEIFDWLWDNFSSVQRHKSGSVRDLTFEVPLTRKQARQGGIAKVFMPVQAVCPTCRGLGGIGPYECMRCAGEGAISGEVPVSISFPPGISGDHAVMVPLARFGIRNLHLTVLFRSRDTERI